LNGAATSNTDTGGAIAEGSEFTLRVECVNRVVSFFYDGAAPATTVSHTFDANEKVIPFLFFLHSTDVAGTVFVARWEFGKLVSRD
jgi:hypothetical protein